MGETIIADPNAAGTLVAAGVVCVGCGYDLRTLSRDAVCPECGQAIAVSEAAHGRAQQAYGDLRANGIPWMCAIRESLNLALLSWLAVSLFGSFAGMARTPRYWWDLLLPATSLVLCGCAWRLFSPGTRPFNMIGRAVLFLVLLGIVSVYLDDRWASYYFGKSGPLPWPLGDRLFDAAATFGRTIYVTPWIAAAMFIGRLGTILLLARRTWLFRLLVLDLLGLTAVFLRLLTTWLRPIPSQVVEPILLASWSAMPVLFLSLLYTLTRAIRLAESSAASSHSSPSPPPPA